MARYLPRVGAILVIAGIIVLMALCLVGLLRPNSLNAGIFPSSADILPARAVPIDPNTPPGTPLPPEAQAAATAAALVDVLPFADALNTAIATLRPSDAAVAGLPTSTARRATAVVLTSAEGGTILPAPGAAAASTAAPRQSDAGSIDRHDPDSRDRWGGATAAPLPGAPPTSTPQPAANATPLPGAPPTSTPQPTATTRQPAPTATDQTAPTSTSAPPANTPPPPTNTRRAVPTSAPQPTDVPPPTSVPQPTDEPPPTRTPKPTDEPPPTRTPKPTDVPPTSAPPPTDAPPPP
ncbi:MAG: hypothetical protein ACJ8CR_01660, partial [Roseiflexaceae bacterium]